MQSRGQSGDECCDLPIFIEIFFVEQISRLGDRENDVTWTRKVEVVRKKHSIVNASLLTRCSESSAFSLISRLSTAPSFHPLKGLVTQVSICEPAATMVRGRSLDLNLPPTKALIHQRDYRARKAAKIVSLRRSETFGDRT